MSLVEQKWLEGELTYSKIDALKELISMLEPFEKVTDLTQEDQAITVSSISPVFGLRATLCLNKPDESNLFRYAEPMHTKLREACTTCLEQLKTK